MDSEQSLRIGTRSSPLALKQTEMVVDALVEHAIASRNQIEINKIKTTGDRIDDRALGEAGGKGLFTLEIENALLEGRIDLAVHSMKDMPTQLPAGLMIAALLPRENPADCLICAHAKNIQELKKGALVGTASLRRQAQLLNLRPELRVEILRGSVGTRLQRIKEGRFAATLLAYAGLKRLQIMPRQASIIPTEILLPAVAQGIVGVQIRQDNQHLREQLRAINHQPTMQAYTAEREFLAEFEGSCRTPIAALAQIGSDSKMTLRAEILRKDGSERLACQIVGEPEEAETMGRQAAEQLKAQASADFLLSLRE